MRCALCLRIACARKDVDNNSRYWISKAAAVLGRKQLSWWPVSHLLKVISVMRLAPMTNMRHIGNSKPCCLHKAHEAERAHAFYLQVLMTVSEKQAECDSPAAVSKGACSCRAWQVHKVV